MVDSISGDRRELNGVQADRQDVCTGSANKGNRWFPPCTITPAVTLLCITPGCGATVEELPYLEIVCVSDATSHSHQSPAAEGEAQVKEEGSATKIPQSFEKQDSLITLAWSKPPEDDTDCEEQSQGGEGCMQTQVQPTDISSIAEHRQSEETFGDREDLRPTLMWSDSTGHSDPQAADQQCSTVRPDSTSRPWNTLLICCGSDFFFYPFLFSLVDTGGESGSWRNRERKSNTCFGSGNCAATPLSWPSRD